MYMNGTHQDTIKIHAGYIKIHQDTYPIGKTPKTIGNPTSPFETVESGELRR